MIASEWVRNPVSFSRYQASVRRLRPMTWRSSRYSATSGLSLKCRASSGVSYTARAFWPADAFARDRAAAGLPPFQPAVRDP